MQFHALVITCIPSKQLSRQVMQVGETLIMEAKPLQGEKMHAFNAFVQMRVNMQIGESEESLLELCLFSFSTYILYSRYAVHL